MPPDTPLILAAGEGTGGRRIDRKDASARRAAAGGDPIAAPGDGTQGAS